MVACLLMYMSLATRPCFAGEPEQNNAHFYIRYDNTTPDEGTPSEAHSYTHYFPVGETAPDWKPGSDTDRHSPDGKVATDSANVPDTENIISSGHVNLYHSFNVSEDTIKSYFGVVYNNIEVAPSKAEIADSVGRFMGSDWKQAYLNGNVDVLWYVIKRGQDKIIHVDGVLYYVVTGEIADKKDPAPVEPIEPEPDTPEVPDVPEVPDTPEEPEQPTIPEEPNISQEPGESVVVEPVSAGQEEAIAENEIPMAKLSPETGDSSVMFLSGLEILCLFGFAGIMLYLRKNL